MSNYGYLNKIKKAFSIIKILLRVEKCFRVDGCYVLLKYCSVYLADVNKMQPDRQKLRKTKIKNPAYMILSENGNHLELRYATYFQLSSRCLEMC